MRSLIAARISLIMVGGPPVTQAGRIHCWIEAALSTWLVCPGDLDGDGDTDHADLGILLADWGCAL